MLSKYKDLIYVMIKNNTANLILIIMITLSFARAQWANRHDELVVHISIHGIVIFEIYGSIFLLSNTWRFKDSNSSVIITLEAIIISKLRFKDNYTLLKIFVRFYWHCGHVHSILTIFDAAYRHGADNNTDSASKYCHFNVVLFVETR